MNEIFIWTFSDVVGLVLLVVVLLVALAVFGVEVVKYATKKVKGWFKRTA